MRARVGGSGIIINLTIDDKVSIDKEGKVEGRFSDYKNPTITLYVQDEVEKKDPDCEPGFHVDVFPETSPELREHYDVYIKKEIFQRIIKEGYWVSRSFIDRVDFIYFDPNLKEIKR